MNQLKPCPRCNGKMYAGTKYQLDGSFPFVKCSQCGHIRWGNWDMYAMPKVEK